MGATPALPPPCRSQTLNAGHTHTRINTRTAHNYQVSVAEWTGTGRILVDKYPVLPGDYSVKYVSHMCTGRVLGETTVLVSRRAEATHCLLIDECICTDNYYLKNSSMYPSACFFQVH